MDNRFRNTFIRERLHKQIWKQQMVKVYEIRNNLLNSYRFHQSLQINTEMKSKQSGLIILYIIIIMIIYSNFILKWVLIYLFVQFIYNKSSKSQHVFRDIQKPIQ
ncbi:hypothetical protein pb186bvf_000897 [Paramecium bursaria]